MPILLSYAWVEKTTPVYLPFGIYMQCYQNALSGRTTAAVSCYLYKMILGDPDVNANLYSNFAFPYWEGWEICSIYLL